jgi:hypothetical protein
MAETIRLGGLRLRPAFALHFRKETNDGLAVSRQAPRGRHRSTGRVIAARLRASGRTVWLATKDAQQAARLRATGLRVSGVGGDVSVRSDEVAPLDAYGEGDPFDLVVLATKAQGAMRVAPKLVRTAGGGAGAAATTGRDRAAPRPDDGREPERAEAFWPVCGSEVKDSGCQASRGHCDKG